MRAIEENAKGVLFVKSCSFCGRTEEQVARMITSPKADICATCVLICMEILINNLTEYKEISFVEANR